MSNLPKYRITLVPDFDGPDDQRLGLRSKLGGTPTWEQNDETPSCTNCKKPLAFVAQLDSISLPDDDNPRGFDGLPEDRRYIFGDVGLIYVFFCFDCGETRSIFQCT
jgi:uncharacterized protein YwqG